MCGIFGYIGFRKASLIVLKGLRRLEYRGYDSCGIASLARKIQVKKGVGKIEEVDKKLNFLEMEGNIAIGHTRWATHGKVNDVNAHPHLDCQMSICVVHNGIIENYQELREDLERNGHVFRSETDTEVISHLIEDFLKKGLDFEDACKKTFLKLRGSFAALVMKEGEEKIIAVRKDSPLVVGVGKNEAFISSDIAALLEFTNRVIYLSNFDFVSLERGKIKIRNLIEGEVEREIEEIKMNLSEVEKGQYKYYMLKEILEQIGTIKKTALQNRKDVEEFVKGIREAKRIFLIGAGTSHHACLAGSYIFSRLCNLITIPVVASEFPNFVRSLAPDDLMIAISQSGETADVLHSVRLAKARGVKVYSILNVYGSSLARESDLFLLMNCGPEIGVAATKTYTSQLSLLLLIAYTLKGKFEEALKMINWVADVSYDLLAASTRNFIRKIAERIKDKEHIFLIGRGLNYVTALEAALKIKEISYIHAEAFAGGEIKHGTIALIENGVPCITFVSRENEYETISNAIELRSRGGFIIGVASKRNQVFDLWLKVPEGGIADCIIQIIPMQLLAYELAVLRGCDPDKPRNLAKSVTVL